MDSHDKLSPTIHPWRRPHRMSPRASRCLTTVALIVVASATACSRQVLSVFLDLPAQRPKPEQAITARPALDSAAIADSARPPIEREFDALVVQTLLPRDSGGNIDWVRALRDSIIKPRFAPGVPRSVPLDPDFNYDVFLAADSEHRAVFSHAVHLEWSSCQSCHPRRFPRTHEPITHAAMQQGRYCGACHGTVAFPMRSACDRCHREPRRPPIIEAHGELLGDLSLVRRIDTTVTADAATPVTFAPSRFSHWMHRIRYRCSACHVRLFQERAGSTRTSMAEIAEGKSCGACHNGKLAFGTEIQNCDRCHVNGEP